MTLVLGRLLWGPICCRATKFALIWPSGLLAQIFQTVLRLDQTCSRGAPGTPVQLFFPSAVVLAGTITR